MQAAGFEPALPRWIAVTIFKRPIAGREDEDGFRRPTFGPRLQTLVWVTGLAPAASRSRSARSALELHPGFLEFELACMMCRVAVLAKQHTKTQLALQAVPRPSPCATERCVLGACVDVMNVEGAHEPIKSARAAPSSEICERPVAVCIATRDAVLIVATTTDRPLASIELCRILFSALPTPALIRLELRAQLPIDPTVRTAARRDAALLQPVANVRKGAAQLSCDLANSESPPHELQ